LFRKECSEGTISADCKSCIPDCEENSSKVHSKMECQDSDDISNEMNDVCSVDSLILKNCTRFKESTEWIQWNKFKDRMVFEPKSSRTFKQNPNELSSYSCNCTSCGDSLCNGDSFYCANFDCEESNCYCEAIENINSLSTTYNGKVSKPQCWGKSLSVVRREVKLIEKQETPIPLLECYDDKLTIITQSDYRFYRICKDGECISGSYRPQISLPSDMMDRTGLIEVTTWGENDHHFQTVLCEKNLVCPKCILCISRFRHSACYDWLTYSMSLVIVSLILYIPLKFIAACLKLYLMMKMSRPKSVLACDNISTYNVKGVSCEQNGVNKTCHIRSTSVVNLSSENRESCLVVKDDENIVNSFVTFRTKKVMIRCRENLMYYTNEHKSHCKYEKRCRKSGKCDDDNCENVTQDSNIMDLGDEMKKKGWSYCTRACGCAGCGCFYCSSGCLWWRKYLSYAGYTYSVSECKSWEYHVHGELIVSKDNIKSTQVLCIEPGQKKKIGPYTLSLESVTNIPGLLKDECVIKDLNNNEEFISKCSALNSPIVGTIGEVQCPTKTSADSMSNECLASPDIIEHTAGDSSVSCIAKGSYVRKLVEGKKLPMIKDGMFLYRETDGNLYMDLDHRASFSLVIEANGVIMMDIVRRSTCNVIRTKIKGCHSCKEGATIEIDYTSSGNTTSYISCSESLSFPLYLEGNKTLKRTVNFYKKDINLLCKLSCGIHVSEFFIRGILDDPLVILKKSLRSIKSVSIEKSSFINYDIDLFNFFDLTKRLIIISVIALSVCLIILISWFFMRKHRIIRKQKTQ